MTTLIACGGSNDNSSSSVFGVVQIIDQINISGEVVGQRGFVTANYSLLTDELLIELYHSHISGTGFNFFTIDFEDGTGYVFPSSRNRFTHQELDWEGAGINPVGAFGFIYEDRIDWFN